MLLKLGFNNYHRYQNVSSSQTKKQNIKTSSHKLSQTQILACSESICLDADTLEYCLNDILIIMIIMILVIIIVIIIFF